MSTWSIEWVREPLGIACLQPEWDALWRASEERSPFSAWGWVYPWSRHIGRGALQVLCIRERGRLIGLLPLLRARIGPLLEYRLAASGLESLCDGRDLLSEAGREAEVIEACVETLRLDTRWDSFCVGDLDSSRSMAATLVRRLGIGAERRLGEICPVVHFGASFASYLGSRSRELLGQLKRKRGWFERSQGFAFRCLKSPEEVAAGLEQLFHLHRQSMLRRKELSMFMGDEAHRHFHREAAQQLAKLGAVRLYQLETADHLWASIYGFRGARSFYYYQNGFDTSQPQRSAGSVLLFLLLEESAKQGVEEFNFLRGEQGYKTAWATGERRTEQLRYVRLRPLAQASAMSRRVFASGKTFLQEHLSEAQIQALRRVRHKEP